MSGGRVACVLLTLLATGCVLGPAAGAAGTGWHVTTVRSLGKRIGGAKAGAINRFGTSIVVFASRRSFTVVRRRAHASQLKTVGRVSAHRPSVLSLTALANGRFLLAYMARHRLLARDIDAGGHFRGGPHVLATGYSWAGNLLFPASPSPVVADSDASRTVVAWGVTHGTTQRVEGAIDDKAGWSRPKTFYTAQSSQTGPFRVQLVGGSQDRFLVSVQGANGDTTSVMWGLPGGSQRWERVTPPQVADGSPLARQNGAKVASVDGTITAAWQDASAALVVSTWNGSTWTAPVTAVAGSHSSNGPVTIDPVFVSEGSRVALVWSDVSKGLFGPVEATIRAGAGGSWSAPVVFPHSRGEDWLPSLNRTVEFWFTASGALAGVWSGDPITGSWSTGKDVAGLYVGRTGGNGASATVLSRSQSGTTGRIWFALPRGVGLHTVVWADKKGRAFATMVTGDGVIRHQVALPACGFPAAVSANGEAVPHLLLIGGTTCPAALLW